MAQRAQRTRASRKLAILSNAGRVGQYHDLTNVRRNSLVIAAAQEKLRAWECKKLAIKQDLDILRYQDEDEARDRNSNLSAASLDLRALKRDSLLYATKGDSLKGMIADIKTKSRQKHREARRTGTRRSLVRRWAALIFLTKATIFFDAAIPRLPLAAVIRLRVLKRAVSAKICRKFIQAAVPKEEPQQLVRDKFRRVAMRMRQCSIVIQRAFRDHREYRHTQYVLMALMKAQYEGPDSPLRIQTKNKRAKDFANSLGLFRKTDNQLEANELSFSRETGQSLLQLVHAPRPFPLFLHPPLGCS